MTIKINSPRVVQVLPEEYYDCARGYINKLPNKNFNVGDRILIKERADGYYTGREILGEVTEVNGEEFTFRKYSVTHDKSRGSENKRNERINPNKNKRRFNAYI